MALALEFDLGWGAGGRIGHLAWKDGNAGSRPVREWPRSQVVNTVWQLKDDHVEGHRLLAGRAARGWILNTFLQFQPTKHLFPSTSFPAPRPSASDSDIGVNPRSGGKRLDFLTSSYLV